MVSTADYMNGVHNVIAPEFSKYVHMLVGLCNVKMPTIGAIEGYFLGQDITATREVFNLIEGCADAFNEAIDARIEYYAPCFSLIERINRCIYNGYKFSSSKQFDEEKKKELITDTDLFRRLTHSKTMDELFINMVELLKCRMFTQWHYATTICYVESILLYNYSTIWDITKVQVSEMRGMIANARTGDSGKLREYFMSNLVSLMD